MSLARYAPQRLRARYLQALKALPIPAPLPDPIDPARLTTLGRARIAGRPVVFGTLADAPRLWVAFSNTDTDTGADSGGSDADTVTGAGTEPVLLGYLTGLVTGEPDLWVCNETHRSWTLTGDNTAHLKRAAAHVR